MSEERLSERETTKPAEVAALTRLAPLPRVSEYARRQGYVPAPIRQRLPRPA